MSTERVRIELTPEEEGAIRRTCEIYDGLRSTTPMVMYASDVSRLLAEIDALRAALAKEKESAG